MAKKFTPKKNKVTGTKKKDKITWVSSKAWKKALTVNAGKGNDIINFKKSKYKNTLNGQDGNDVIYGGKNIDKINGGNGNDKLYGYNGNDIIKAGAGKDYVDGGNGNDKIYGGSGDNLLKGGSGNDTIYGGTGADRIIYAKNTGNDVVYNAKNNDTVVLSNIDSPNSDYSFYNTFLRRNGNDLIIFQGGNDRNGKITLKNYFTQSASTRLNTVYFEKTGKTFTIPSDIEPAIVYYAKGDIYGTNESDEISVTSGYSTVHASNGYDTINFNNTGHNTFTYDTEGISYTGAIVKGLNGTDTICVENVSDIDAFGENSELNVSLPDYNDIYISGFADNEAVLDTKIRLANNYEASLRTYLTDSGHTIVKGNETLSSSDTKVIGTNGAVTITGSSTGSGVTIASGSANDVINLSHGDNEIRSKGGNDTINISGGTYNRIIAGEGNNVINITGGDYNSVVEHSGANDKINISGGNNHISNLDYVNSANITLNGGKTDVTVSDKTNLVVNGGENTINYPNAKTTINGGYNILYGSDENDTISVAGGTNTIIGGEGNDVINGNPNGGNTFVYQTGDGSDIISASIYSDIHADTILFSNLNLSDLSMDFEGKDALIRYQYGGDEGIRIKDILSGDNIWNIKKTNIWVKDKNGEKCRLTDLYVNETIPYGTEYSDVLWSFEEEGETLSGGLGNDTMRSYGADTMYGGEGKNKYEFMQAFGSSSTNPSIARIISTSGQDTIFVDNPSTVSFDVSDSDVIIKYSKNSKYTNIILDSWLENPVDVIFNNSSTTVSILDKVKELGISFITCGTGGNDTLSNVGGYCIAGSGNDSITASGSIMLFGGAGYDTLEGSDSNDRIYSNYATVVEGTNFGVMIGDTNRIIGGKGNDTIYVYGEDAWIHDMNGSDEYHATLSNNLTIQDLHVESTDDYDRLYLDKPEYRDAQRAYIICDVKQNRKLNDMSDGLFVLNKSSYDYWLEFGTFENANGEYGGIRLYNGTNDISSDYAVDFIVDENERSMTGAQIYSLAQDVAGWLTSRGYESTSDAIQKGSLEDKTSLIALFNNFNDTKWSAAMG